MNKYDSLLKDIRLLAEGKQPAEDLYDFLLQHQCFYFLSKTGLSEGKGDYIKKELLMNKIYTKVRYSSCEPVFIALEKENIPYAVIKGAVLAEFAYGDIQYRKSADIDFLIKKEHSDAVKEILFKNGFIQGRIQGSEIKPFTRREIIYQSTMSHQTAPFVKKTDSPLCPFTEIDINMDILWGESRVKSDMDFVLSHTIKHKICETELYILSPEMQFISLCLHHYKDMNSIFLLYIKGFALSQFCDIYFFIHRNTLDITVLESLCKQLQAAPYVYYCLYLTNLIFNDELLKRYISCFESEQGKKILNTYGLTDEEQKEWSISFLDRLFTHDLHEYLDKHLTAEDYQKIETNKLYM